MNEKREEEAQESEEINVHTLPTIKVKVEKSSMGYSCKVVISDVDVDNAFEIFKKIWVMVHENKDKRR